MKNTTQPNNHRKVQGPDAAIDASGASTKQVRARAAAKDAHLKEAGLGGSRTGAISEAVKRAQAERDAANDATFETVENPETGNPSEATHTDHDDAPTIPVQVNTDHNITGSQKLTLNVEHAINESLARFARQLTRVVVHLSDENGSKSHGDDKRCLIEARPAGHQPLVVTAVAPMVDDAVSDAIEKMERLLNSTFEKLYDPKGRPSLGEQSVM